MRPDPIRVARRHLAADFSHALDVVELDDLVEVNEAYIFDVTTLRRGARSTVIKGQDGSGQRFELTIGATTGTLKTVEDDEPVSMRVHSFRVVGAE